MLLSHGMDLSLLALTIFILVLLRCAATQCTGDLIILMFLIRCRVCRMGMIDNDDHVDDDEVAEK